MRPLLLLLLSAALWLCLGCGMELPRQIPRTASPGPCGQAGQRCCDPRDGLPDGGGPTHCNAGLACLPAPMGRDAGVGAVGVCQACPADRIACNGACVDPSQVSNCGGCGNVCGPGQACVATTGGGGGGAMDGGVASDAGPIGPAFACTVDCTSMPGTTRCGAACVNTSSDLANCGGCGNRCNLSNAANVCTNGMCAVQSCLSGFANCDNAAPNGCEVNTQTDVNHCGGCGNRCNLPNATAACGNGACRIMACNAGFADCDQIAANGCEVNVATDASNCARCGNRCPGMAGATAICIAGVCRIDGVPCTAPLASCDGNSTNGCEVNTNTDVNNCGRCRNVCTVTNGTPACNGGSCAIATCNVGRADCNRMLMDGCEVNTQTDDANCGGCGNRCNLPNATAVCMAGGCRIMACNTGFADCDGMPGNGCEQSLRSDNTNCGICGNACTSGRFCTNGACACPSGQTFCVASNACLNLQSDNNNCGACGNACGGGTSCQMGMCRCPTGQSLCSGVCVNLSNDLANCGTCGTRCPSGTVCSTVSGMTACRVSCPSGQQNCSGSCVALATDPANCGMCGTRCRTGESCTAGVCSCPSGQSFCAGVGCVNQQTDNTNCGACGNVCNNGRFCSNRMCVCPSGQTFCMASNACQNLQTDNNNCGACGRVCTTGQACVAGVCQNTCPSGQIVCNGLCRDTRTDFSHCGACGTACTGGRTCQASVCACPSGQAVCSGTCRTLASDNSHCGACGTVCMGGTSCQSGMCRCPAGQTFCGGVCVNTSNDTGNCGMCGTVCNTSMNQVCASGTCTTACPAGQTNCSGTCRTLATDVDGCGACTNVCATVTNGTRTCTSGSCGFTCNSGLVASGGMCVPCGGLDQPVCTGGMCLSGLTNCGGTCRGTSSSVAHCGMSCTVCAVPSNGSATCASGVCGINCNTGFNPSGSMCVPCGANGQPACVSGTACTAGTLNVMGTCRTCGGLDQPACLGGVCTGRTVNVSGTCRACGAQQGQPACTTGAACDMPFADCGGTCRDVRFDPAHCGTCNNDCGGVACSAGSCNNTLCGSNGTRCGVSPGMSMNCAFDTTSCITGTATTVPVSSGTVCACL